MIQGNTVFVPASTVAYRIIGGSAVLVNIQDNAMLRLNETGSRIWSLLDGRSVKEIATEISGQFDVTEEESLQDTREFMELMSERGLVVVRPIG